MSSQQSNYEKYLQILQKGKSRTSTFAESENENQPPNEGPIRIFEDSTNGWHKEHDLQHRYEDKFKTVEHTFPVMYQKAVNSLRSKPE